MEREEEEDESVEFEINSLDDSLETIDEFGKLEYSSKRTSVIS